MTGLALAIFLFGLSEENLTAMIVTRFCGMYLNLPRLLRQSHL
jgi:hypothetical protein